jgi:hypothetical protein
MVSGLFLVHAGNQYCESWTNCPSRDEEPRGEVQRGSRSLHILQKNLSAVVLQINDELDFCPFRRYLE